MQNPDTKDKTRSVTLQQHSLHSLLLCLWPLSILPSLPLTLTLPPRPRSVSTTPSQHYSSPLVCVPFSLRLDSGVYVRARVVVWVIWGSGWAESLSSRHSWSISPRCSSGETTTVGFLWYLILCNCPLWQFSEWGVGSGGGPGGHFRGRK